MSVYVRKSDMELRRRKEDEARKKMEAVEGKNAVSDLSSSAEVDSISSKEVSRSISPQLFVFFYSRPKFYALYFCLVVRR